LAKDWYHCEVNKGAINMRTFAGKLNGYREKGYRLAHIVEQAGNTIMVFEWVGIPES
jgi:hypothetical protein